MNSSNTPKKVTTRPDGSFTTNLNPSSRAVSRLSTIRLDVATAEVIDALTEAGITSIVLKGAALYDWYPNGQPPYADGDLWVAPADLSGAARVLQNCGFEPSKDEGGLPQWWLEHASEWHRERDLAAIDLHRYLQGIGVKPDIAWPTLCEHTEAFTLAGRTAQRLDTPARALYVTLHAIHHGVQHVNSLRHLTAALDVLDEREWCAAGELAVALDAVQEFKAGLQLVPAGRELADRLDLREPTTTRSHLKASSPPPQALTVDEIATARGFRKLEILWHKLFPPPGFIRHWWPPAARSRTMLVVGYAYRPLWIMKSLPGALRAYWTAHGKARRGR